MRVTIDTSGDAWPMTFYLDIYLASIISLFFFPLSGRRLDID